MENSSFSNQQELMSAFHRNDETAISEVFTEFYPILVDYAFQLVKDWDEAQNLSLHSFLQLLEKRRHLKEHSRIKSFLYIATRNNCFMYLRKVESETRFQKEATYLGRDFEQHAEMDYAKMDVEIINALYAEIDKLPQQCKAVFTKRYLENLSPSQVAEELGIANKTVRNQTVIALKLLRSGLSARNLTPASIIFLLFSFFN